MLNSIIILLSIFGLTYAIQNASIFSIPRNWLMRKSVFFFKLLSCSFCSGFHAGWVIYLISQKNWSINFLFIWGLAGAAFSLIMALIVNKLSAGDFN